MDGMDFTCQLESFAQVVSLIDDLVEQEIVPPVQISAAERNQVLRGLFAEPEDSLQVESLCQPENSAAARCARRRRIR